MSLEKTIVTLKLQSGKRFDGIAIKNAESKLAEFLDGALKQLEDESQIQLPDTEEELVHPSHFQVYDERRRQQLSLQLPLSQQPYLVECLQCKETPVLLLISRIFLDAVEVDREKNVEKVLRRKTVSEGSLRTVKHHPPKAPTRSSSLISSSRLRSREAMIYMAGRMESTPTCSRLKRVHSPSRLSIMSSDSFSYNEDLIENLFPANISISGGSGDTNSVQSSMLTSMELDSGQFNRPTSALSSRNHFLRRGSDATTMSEPAETMSRTPENLSKPPSLAHDAASLGAGTSRETSPRSSLLTYQKARTETPSPQTDVSRQPLVKLESWVEESDRPHEKIPLRTALSVPTSVVIEESSDVEGEGLTMINERDEGEEIDKCMELSSPPSTLERRGRRTKTPPTPTRIAAMGTGRAERELSPTLLDPPLSPDRQVSPVVSPTSSPRLRHRKTRIATRKRTHKKSLQENDGNPEEAGVEPAKSFIRQRRTIYDRKSHVTSAFFGHSRVFGTIKTFVVDFEIQIADVIVQREIRGDNTVGQIKDNLWSFLREQGYILEEEIGFLGDPENFTFTYQMNGETHELYDEQQLFQTSTAAQLWRSERRDKGTLNVEMKSSESKEEKTMNMEISAMIGIGLYQLQFANNDELDITRRKMIAVRRNAVRSRDPVQYCMETELMFQALPRHVQDQIQDDKILIRVYYKEGSYQTFQMDVHTTADEFLPQVFPDDESKRLRLGIPATCDVDDYVLKIAGEDSYIYGSCELIQFTYIVNCLSKKNEIELALVKKVDSSLDKPRDIPDGNLIDNSTGLTGTHSDLSALSKEHTQVFTMSMWDIQRKFRIRVVGLDNFHSPDIEVVYIDAGIYHGGELLVGEKSTSEVSSTTYPRWNQWLVFDIAVKNLPKAARLCIQVVGGTRAKEVKRKSLRGRSRSTREDKKDQVDKPLHWVNMQILDHRSLLRQGVQGLNLWPILSTSSGSNTWSPMGSTAINPDGNHSAVLYIELDSYAHPVACPTGGWGETAHTSAEQSLKEGSRFWKDLEKSIRTDPLFQLDKAQQELIWKFRAHCSTIPEALPKFLRCVDWADLDQVCEVHRLIKIWRPITLEVALELLDYHFADEKVRSLAVRRLEKLSIGEVLCFLLQLIQVLKFEPYHDSALARFLLKKALQSKRIGHFFYWYLRSEMDTPEFNQRFGILLEAYLRGCGEAMFQEIQNQHKAVCDLMQVAGSVKRYLDGGQDRKKVINYAREQLSKYQLPAAFCPPYDPTLKMGALNITKSRVMDSKKSPLWLEFENMDPTVVTNRPIKVIAKHGDDLRQDMLTLQMLALMDKMWQSHGLDLFIIPYGCIATGNNMGVIQVVQEAETVAKIQLKYGGSFSALKEEPLHDWLKKQNPTQNRFDAAVERFMLSCAGYCVATYVLGIGDRHNDNIMVTTSGNLFHIDFGHFLGHKKEFLGVNRERAPFVLTPDFEYVMGKRNSEMFRRFEETAVKAYMIIRKNANLIINLFSMMKCTGIPELRSVEDIEYLRSVLVLDKSEKAAEEHFKSQIQKCQKVQWSTQINWLTHNLAHRN